MFSIKAGSGWIVFGAGASGFLLLRRARRDADSLPPPCDAYWQWAPWSLHSGREQALNRLTAGVADIDARHRLRCFLAEDESRIGLRLMSDAQVLREVADMLASGRLAMMRQVLSDVGRRRHVVSTARQDAAPLAASFSSPRPRLAAGAPAPAPQQALSKVAEEREPFEHDAQAMALVQAARDGKAFCQECAKAAPLPRAA